MSSFPVAPTVKLLSWINQYTVSFALSSIAPIQRADALNAVPSMYFNVVSLTFPFEFSITPISAFSVEPIRMLRPSTYSPSGIRRSSTTLFILPAIKFLVIFAILLYLLVHSSQVHQETAGVNVADSNFCIT